jgi:hypothetical protein
VTADDDRIAFLAGEPGGPLSSDDQHDLEGLRDLLADPAMWADPDPALEDRVVTAIASEAGLSAAGPQPSQSHRRTRGRRPLRYVLAGVAAAAVIAIALVVSSGGGGRSAPQFAAALAPTNLAPQAAGGASLTPTEAGWRVVLHVSGLPRLDNGRFYQAWMVDATGARVSIGTFNQGPSVTLWSGVSPTEFPIITVTAQDTASGPTAPGGRVLVGQVKLGPST